MQPTSEPQSAGHSASNMINKHEKHFSTVANHGGSDDEHDNRRARRDSVVSDAGLWSIHSVDGGSERDELEDITTEFHDSSTIRPLGIALTSECPKSEADVPSQSPEISFFSPTQPLSETPLCDNLLEWFDEQTQKFGFEDKTCSHSTSIKILPTEDDWMRMIKLSTQAQIAYLLRRFCPESTRASWFISREKLFFSRLTPPDMIRYLYLGPVDREILLRTYFKTLGFNEGWLISEERKKALARFVFEGEAANIAKNLAVLEHWKITYHQ
ncbi:hypothetical protein D9619_007563 [Psilocybe cf. subviscida]|uniref:Uncharacterized protein n=1 Tax=Psilocybe cf. subviscida TaxID=2480587 RepID=A0A8H5EWK3_9AGAR|nr:hypothetical protein D9619_007563 [Psilocybe cf. subviscida]